MFFLIFYKILIEYENISRSLTALGLARQCFSYWPSQCVTLHDFGVANANLLVFFFAPYSVSDQEIPQWLFNLDQIFQCSFLRLFLPWFSSCCFRELFLLPACGLLSKSHLPCIHRAIWFISTPTISLAAHLHCLPLKSLSVLMNSQVLEPPPQILRTHNDEFS